MEAYVAFDQYRSNFDSPDFAKTVVKQQGEKQFALVLGRKTKQIADDEAMYLYGGRQALLNALQEYGATAGGFGLKSATGQDLVVFHGRITAGLKTKRLLMITPNVQGRVAAVGANKQLKVPNTNGTYELMLSKPLQALIRSIPD